ncbi:MAG: hypothetical protein H6811_05330 [Phycisphaeraceae bacterium]|nr:hypothetical protein [Phycisphaeraceae bacterium]
MSGLESLPLVSPWLAGPAAALTMVVIATHASALRSSGIPSSRRRIRSANAAVMLLTTPVIAYALAVANGPREFLLSWMAVIGLLTIVISLACIDMVNNTRLHRASRRDLRVQLMAARARLREAAAEARRQRDLHSGGLRADGDSPRA